MGIRKEFNAAEQNLSEKENNLFKAKKDLVLYYELKEKIGIVYEGRVSEKFTREQALQTLSKFPSINEKNYGKIDALIENQSKALSAAEKNVQAAEYSKRREVYVRCKELCKENGYVGSRFVSIWNTASTNAHREVVTICR